jgi:creatinine amidohydrolase/Fe(II)-dependent formamide hydrolase-like protein
MSQQHQNIVTMIYKWMDGCTVEEAVLYFWNNSHSGATGQYTKNSEELTAIGTETGTSRRETGVLIVIHHSWSYSRIHAMIIST